MSCQQIECQCQRLVCSQNIWEASLPGQQIFVMELSLLVLQLQGFRENSCKRLAVNLRYLHCEYHLGQLMHFFQLLQLGLVLRSE